ncbi:effector-associated constant component EACC1 [Nonomuraea angiospora]
MTLPLLEVAVATLSAGGVLTSVASLLRQYFRSKRSNTIEIRRGDISISINLDDPEGAKKFLDDVTKHRIDGRGVVE